MGASKPVKGNALGGGDTDAPGSNRAVKSPPAWADHLCVLGRVCWFVCTHLCVPAGVCHFCVSIRVRPLVCACSCVLTLCAVSDNDHEGYELGRCQRTSG